MTALSDWLTRHGLETYHERLAEQRVDLDVLAELTEADLADLGVPLGDRKRLMKAIAALGSPAAEVAPFAQMQTAAPVEQEDELRQLTLMFADLVGSTSLAKELEIEDYRDAIRTYQVCCTDLIRAHHGYVAQFLGDGVMAYFGYPQAAEDDAERAVAAGLDIVGQVSRLDVVPGRSMNARVGIATGDVLIGDLVGERLSIRGAVLGETPNLAARLQAKAEPGQVVLTDSTHRLLGPHIECRSLGLHQIRGITEPMGIWLAERVRASESRFAARARGPMTAFVGRSDEQDILRNRWRAAVRGEGQVVLIAGEAGIGKSRLVEWLSAEIVGEPHVRLSYQCSPYHKGSALFPVIMQIAHAADLKPSDTDDQKLDKIERLIAGTTDEPDDTAALFARLLSIPFEHRYGALEDPAEQIRRRTIDALFDQLAALSRREPVLVFFEDVHWMDPSTAEVLDRLVEHIQDLPVLFIATFRPEHESTWVGRAGVTTLTIPRLDRRRSLAMVERIAEGENVPLDVIDKIVERTEGVPLFIEELTRTVIERRRLSKDGRGDSLVLPSSLKDLLMAKLDSLSSARELVPLCAAIGRSFPYGLLARVAEMSDEALKPVLEQLTSAHIMVRQGDWPEPVLSFRHALIQEAAYDTMLASRARRLHARIAEVLSQDFKQIAEARPEVVAQHFARADMPKEARDRWRGAAARAVARSANAEACAHLEAALVENARLPEDESTVEAEIAIREMLREPLELTRWGSIDLELNLKRLYDLRSSRGEDEALFAIVYATCGTHTLAGHISKAQEAATQMAAIAEEQGDPAMLILSEHTRAILALLGGRFGEAIDRFEREIGMLAPEHMPGVREHYVADPAVVARVMQAWALVLDGANGRADARMAEATALIKDHDQPFSQIYGLAILASVRQTRGDAEAALDLATRAYDLAGQHKVPYWEAWTSMIIGWAKVAGQGDDAGEPLIRKGLQDYARTGAGQILSYGRALLADALYRLGRLQEALGVIEALEEDKDEVRFFNGERDRIARAVRAAVGQDGGA